MLSAVMPPPTLHTQGNSEFMSISWSPRQRPRNGFCITLVSFQGQFSDETDFLRATDESKDLKAVRLCTDFVRVEDNGQGVDLNLDAGYNIAKFFHDRVPNLPLLVHTHDYNIMNTKFVKHWPAAGSTCDKLVIHQFIDEMVSEGDNKLAWAVFDAKAETGTKA